VAVAPTYRPPPPDAGSDDGAAVRRHSREVAAAAAIAMQGKINAVTSVTLTANVTTTVITDPRLTINSFVGFDPTTANAAAELAAGTIYALTANRNNASWTLTHANAATTDRTFKVLIIG
jgi:hypothetical protein